MPILLDHMKLIQIYSITTPKFGLTNIFKHFTNQTNPLMSANLGFNYRLESFLMDFRANLTEIYSTTNFRRS